MDSLYPELYCIIAFYISIRDIINLSRTCKIINGVIIVNFSNYVYALASKSDINISGRKYITNNELYKLYHRCKSTQIKPYTDIKFEITDSEYILFFNDTTLQSNNPGSIIITINRNLKYTVYEFQQEVDQDNERDHNAYSWDYRDINKRVLIYEQKYDTINTVINRHLKIIYSNDVSVYFLKRLACYPLLTDKYTDTR